MAKLHIYQKNAKKEQWDTKAGDGDGELSATQAFDVTMTKIEIAIRAGNVYQIRQGTSATGDLYTCNAGAARRNDTARFTKNT